VTFCDDNSNALKFHYQIHMAKPQNTPADSEKEYSSPQSKDTHSLDGTNSITTNKSNTVIESAEDERWHMCYGTSSDLTEMITAFWPNIQQFIDQHSMHDHAIQWQQWIQQDHLHKGSDLNQLKHI
jgi:hypothetical protein